MKTISLLLFSSALAAAQSISERLQKGLFEEEAKHNLPAAIEEYKAVIAETDEHRRLTATAIFRLAESYRKLGRTNEALPLYERVLHDFSDQTQLVQRASARLPERKAERTEGSIRQPEYDFAALDRLLDNSPDLLNSPATNKMTFLQHAASRGEIEMIEFLIKRGARLDQTTQQSRETPLMLAVQRGHKRAAEALIKAGSNVNGHGSIGGNTPLEAAASSGYLEVAKLLIDNGADVNLGFRGWTPLHAAAINGHVDVIKLLIKAGANLEAVDNEGKTPLISAILGYFVPGGINQQRVPQPQAVLTMIEAGSDPNNRGKQEPPIQLAVKSPNWLVFGAIMRSDKIDLNTKGSYEMTALMQAVVSDRSDALERLLKLGADLNSQNKDRSTALHLAVQKNDLSWLKMLLENGANPNLQDDQGRSPLHLACGVTRNGPHSANLEAIDLLLQHKADPNLQDKQGSTPLTYAVVGGAVEAVERLLAAKANPNILTNDGYAPLDLNPPRLNLELAKMLKQAGATNSLKSSTNAPMAAPGIPLPQPQSPRRTVREDGSPVF